LGRAKLRHIPGAVTVEIGGLTTGAFFGGVIFPCTVDDDGTTSYGGDDPIGRWENGPG